MKTKSLQESLGAIEANIFLGQSATARIKEDQLKDPSGWNTKRIEQCFARIEELLEELEENQKK